MKQIQRILSYTRKALTDYNMIRENDKIAVGVSAGKDSLTLLAALAELRHFFPTKYQLCAITVDMGFEGVDFTPVADFCRELDVEYKIVKTEIAKIIFDVRKESNPCSLCARMRRGVLHQSAKEMGASRVALGHHFDDSVETFMLNLFFEGRLGSFSPVTYLSNADIYLIRPLIYAREKDILSYTRRVNLPIIESNCPENRHTERENMKILLSKLEAENPGLSNRIYGAMCRGEIDGYKVTEKLPHNFKSQTRQQEEE